MLAEHPSFLGRLSRGKRDQAEFPPSAAIEGNGAAIAARHAIAPTPGEVARFTSGIPRLRDHFLPLVKMAFAACNGAWVKDDRREDGPWRVRPASKAS